MQKLIAFLLRKFTKFRVVAWDQGIIAGIGYYPDPHQEWRPTTWFNEQIIEIDENGKVHGDISGLKVKR